MWEPWPREGQEPAEAAGKPASRPGLGLCSVCRPCPAQPGPGQAGVLTAAGNGRCLQGGPGQGPAGRVGSAACHGGCREERERGPASKDETASRSEDVPWNSQCSGQNGIAKRTEMWSQEDGEDGEDGHVRRGVLRPDVGLSGTTGDPRQRVGGARCQAEERGLGDGQGVPRPPQPVPAGRRLAAAQLPFLRPPGRLPVQGHGQPRWPDIEASLP
ncbi:unnamed protein product [Rangifer tarandus platyrhynchus]|uniref:Uncharacterized protein n=1 Tax=Rangifer tarandus platyrhynchus TaxID=3082113 RepID=A0ABN8ZIW3_RANTA|nr:unnamed protein product [Rangifer tarandus platyrhynchus]